MAHEDSISYGATLRIGTKSRLNQPMPSREELLARNSFGGPSQNKYLNNPRAAEKAVTQRQIEQLMAEVKK